MTYMPRHTHTRRHRGHSDMGKYAHTTQQNRCVRVVHIDTYLHVEVADTVFPEESAGGGVASQCHVLQLLNRPFIQLNGPLHHIHTC